ncbi:MAG: putative oxygen-independent coproporphyrinogen III oxidase [Granulosicoccus sp.]|jgi:putative oxygen-independent coproporphyrinogen III oxidase
MNREFTELPPLSLYVHIPWCVRKCPYCDFNSHEARGDVPEQAYVDALLVDLAEEMPSVWGRTISTVFIGGGTPSLFSAKAIDQLMSGIRALTGLHPTAEVTMEANPGTFEQQRFKDYRDSGINRLSIGIQSFNTKALKALGRVHSADEAIRAVGIAQKAGFDKINLDLMFGLPEQTLKGAMDDLDQALSLGTTHLSCYELTLEPNTLFARFPPKLPSDDLRADMQNAIVKKLREHQFERYEISAYAKSESKTLKGDGAGSASRQRANHNVNYWQFGDYLGIGAGAHAKISSANTGEIVRQWKHKHPKQYLNAKTQSDRIGGRSLIPVQETGLEFMMNALRLIEGFPIPLFEQHTGVSMMPWQRAIESATEKGLLEQKGLNLRATPTGINWLNSTLELFLEGAPSSPGRNAESKNVPAARRYPIIPLKISNK